jgi:hypothetical protein
VVSKTMSRWKLFGFDDLLDASAASEPALAHLWAAISVENPTFPEWCFVENDALNAVSPPTIPVSTTVSLVKCWIGEQAVMSYVSPVRFSGYRISLLPQEMQEPTWRQRLTDIQFILPVIQESMREQYFIDDSYIDIPFEQLVRIIMESGEMFACFADEERTEVCGFVLLRDHTPRS